MAREREGRYLITINNFIINIVSFLLFVVVSFFIYYYLFNVSNIDLEKEFIQLLNIYGDNVIGFKKKIIK